MGSIFALTRIVGNVRTCSCGFPGSFNLDEMVDPEFCKIFKDEHGDKNDHDYYNVNCVTDLDDGGSTVSWVEIFDQEPFRPRLFIRFNLI